MRCVALCRHRTAVHKCLGAAGGRGPLSRFIELAARTGLGGRPLRAQMHVEERDDAPTGILRRCLVVSGSWHVPSPNREEDRSAAAAPGGVGFITECDRARGEDVTRPGEPDEAPALLASSLPVLEPFHCELDWWPVAAGTVDVAVQRMIQLAQVAAGKAAGSGDRHFAEECHVGHAPQHAAVSRLGQDQFLCGQVPERARWQALAAEFSLDQPGDKTVGGPQVRCAHIICKSR